MIQIKNFIVNFHLSWVKAPIFPLKTNFSGCCIQNHNKKQAYDNLWTGFHLFGIGVKKKKKKKKKKNKIKFTGQPSSCDPQVTKCSTKCESFLNNTA